MIFDCPECKEKTIYNRDYKDACRNCSYGDELDWKFVIVVRKDLKMSLGKVVAQSVHAAMRSGLMPDHDICTVTVVTCYVKSEQALRLLHSECMTA